MDDEVVLPLHLVLLEADLLHPPGRVADDVGELPHGDGERLAVDPHRAELGPGVAVDPDERVIQSADGRAGQEEPVGAEPEGPRCAGGRRPRPGS